MRLNTDDPVVMGGDGDSHLAAKSEILPVNRICQPEQRMLLRYEKDVGNDMGDTSGNT